MLPEKDLSNPSTGVRTLSGHYVVEMLTGSDCSLTSYKNLYLVHGY